MRIWYSREISGLFFVEFLSRLPDVVSQAKQSKQLLTKETGILSEETKYIFVQRKEQKGSLFDLMNPEKTVAPSHLTLRCDFDVKFKTRGECP